MQLLRLRTSAVTTLPTILFSNYFGYDSLDSYFFNATTSPTNLCSDYFAYKCLWQLRSLDATTSYMTLCCDYFAYEPR